MKKLLSILATLLMATALYAQKTVTKFLGIPVDGTKTAMIQQLKAKGYQYNSTMDVLTGEFNGKEVILSVVTNNNKVYRIMVKDAVGSSETDIKIRFNTLCQQFENNKKYLAPQDYRIPDDENISYEMLVHNKRYEAVFGQVDVTDSLAFQQDLLEYTISHYTPKQIHKMNEKERNNVVRDYLLNAINHRPVWFIINEEYGKYYILMFYDNEYNQANGEDL